MNSADSPTRTEKRVGGKKKKGKKEKEDQEENKKEKKKENSDMHAEAGWPIESSQDGDAVQTCRWRADSRLQAWL